MKLNYDYVQEFNGTPYKNTYYPNEKEYGYVDDKLPYIPYDLRHRFFQAGDESLYAASLEKVELAAKM